MAFSPDRAAASAPSLGGSSQRGTIARSPLGAIEQQARKIGDADFRLGKRHEALRLGFVPQPVTDSRFGPACTPATLIGGRPRYAHGFKPGHADVGFEAGNARQSAVDDDAHAFDRDRRLGNRRREDDLAVSGFRRRYGAILGRGIEHEVGAISIAVQQD